jgi:hypothetical protein
MAGWVSSWLRLAALARRQCQRSPQTNAKSPLVTIRGGGKSQLRELPDPTRPGRYPGSRGTVAPVDLPPPAWVDLRGGGGTPATGVAIRT